MDTEVEQEGDIIQEVYSQGDHYKQNYANEEGVVDQDQYIDQDEHYPQEFAEQQYYHEHVDDQENQAHFQEENVDHQEYSNEDGYDTTAAYNQNHAFVFIKPHANTPATTELVRTVFNTHGIQIHEEGELMAEEIEAKKLIDQQ